ncbi:MAG TPA: hypothetical protein VEM96_20255 [Pyrinomonadaceae bacterium]|nr:hypothetical protein [Pyrinomonadaceae bacterium]
MRPKLDHYRHHRWAIRKLRNPKVIVWTSIVVIAVSALLILSYLVLHIIYWKSMTATPPAGIRLIVILANMLFGLASTLGFILAIWILGDINPERFTTVQELLRHCIELFDDANKNSCDVKLLILFPNPGQFDEIFKQFDRTFKSQSEYSFSDLKQKLEYCLRNENVNIEIVCFQGDTTSADSTLRKFLEEFYKSESPDISPQILEKQGNIEGYCGPVKNFIDVYLTSDTGRLILEPINPGWFEKMATGEPMIVIGYAKSEAFLGAITFKDRFKFEGFDFEGNVGTIEPLYESMKAKYMAAPISEPSPQNTNP